MYALRLNFTIPAKDPIHLTLKNVKNNAFTYSKTDPIFLQSDQGFFSQTKDPEIDSPKL